MSSAPAKGSGQVEPEGIGAALAAFGLLPRGGFNFEAGEQAPDGPSGTPARSALLVGQAGASTWPHLSRWRAEQPAELRNPFDTWSQEVIASIAQRFSARAVFPFEKPYLPFQQWAIRTEGLRPSPLGILMHPQYGLWHAYRGALLFDVPIDAPAPFAAIHLCDSCSDKPCLSACPVDAYFERAFAYQACLGHLRSGRGQACMTSGCMARNACPYGSEFRYPADVQAHHQRYFAA